MNDPKVSRRRFLGAAVATVGLGVATAGVVRAAANAAPGPPPGRGLGDMVVPDALGGYSSHLLPFAGPFPTQAALQAQIARARTMHLFT